MGKLGWDETRKLVEEHHDLANDGVDGNDNFLLPPKKKKKAKKELPAEVVAKRKEIMGKVKAGEMTKDEGKAALKEFMKEFKKNNPKKKKKKEE